MNILILHDDIETGPLSWVQVFIMLRKGEITPESIARVEGFDEVQSIEEWGLWREGDEVGPFTWDEISEMLEAGVLDLATLARFEGDPELKELQGVIDQSQEICIASENQEQQRWSETFKQIACGLFAKLRIPEVGLPVATGVAIVLLGGLAYFLWPRGSQSPKTPQAEEQTGLTRKPPGVGGSGFSASLPVQTEPVSLSKPKAEPVPTAQPVVAVDSATGKEDSKGEIAPEKNSQESLAPASAEVASSPVPSGNSSTASASPQTNSVAQTAQRRVTSQSVSPAPVAPVSDFFKIDSVKLIRKPPKDQFAVWKITKVNGKPGPPVFRPCFEVNVSVNADIRSDKTFAKVYFYGADDKLIASSEKPSEAGIARKPMYSVPVLFYKDKPNRFFFEIPEKVEKTKWKALFVFGDRNEAQIATYPTATSAFHLDYPEKKIVEDRSSAARVLRKPDMDPLVEHVVRTNNPKMPQITLFLRPPKGISNASEVEGVLAICVLANGLEEMKRELRKEEMTGDYAGLFSFANKHKLAILAWGSRGLWDPGRNYDDLSREKAKEIDESFDLVSAAWARGVKELGEKYGIPQKNFLLWGNCGSAQFAARLCLRRPEFFLAVHVHMPGSYDKPTPEAAKVLWCLTIGELEGGYERSKRWVKTVRDMGYPIVYKAIPGLGHSGHPDAAALGFKFFEFALMQKNKRDALEEKVTKWKIFDSETRAEPWLEEFRSPVFYADMVNQEIYPANEADMIPEGFRIAIPSKEIADIWAKDK